MEEWSSRGLRRGELGDGGQRTNRCRREGGEVEGW